jgi:hypothetical protein
VRNSSHGRISRSARALLAIATLLALVAGCGGGGDDSGSEARSRKELEAAGKKLTAAHSFDVSLQIELEEDGSDAEEVGCVDLGVDSRKPESIDMRIYDLNCSGGTEGKELIAIGHRAWATSEPANWTAAKITPAVVHELNEEQTTDLQGLFEAAEDIKQVPRDTAVEETAGGGEPKAEFQFKAPASAFPDAKDLGDIDVDFQATVDDKGFLTQLVLHGEAEGAGATVTETYERINSELGIEPPADDEVHGTVQQIGSRDELEALVGATP